MVVALRLPKKVKELIASQTRHFHLKCALALHEGGVCFETDVLVHAALCVKEPVVIATFLGGSTRPPKPTGLYIQWQTITFQGLRCHFAATLRHLSHLVRR